MGFKEKIIIQTPILSQYIMNHQKSLSKFDSQTLKLLTLKFPKRNNNHHQKVIVNHESFINSIQEIIN